MHRLNSYTIRVGGSNRPNLLHGPRLHKFMSERKMKLTKRTILLTILLVPSSWPLSALSWNSLTYQEAALRCSRGDQYACQLLYQYEEYERRYYHGYRGSPADNWLSPDEIRREKRGIFSHGDLVR